MTLVDAPALASATESAAGGGFSPRSLLRNGRAIALSSSLTSGLGFLYWVLAARTYSPAAIGISYTAISAMQFVGGLASLNLPNALIRLIPSGGARVRRLVGASYGVVIALGIVASLVFVAGLRWWAPPLRQLGSPRSLFIGFTLATAAWCAFLLQDGALAGMRKAIWIPVENGVFAVAKIAFLLLLSSRFPVSGVFLSWALALVVSVLPTNVLIFKRLLPRSLPAQAPVSSEPVRLLRYVGADYASSLCWMSATLLVPLFVLDVAGSKANASFSIAWSMAYAIYLIAIGMGQSLVAEASTNPEGAAAFSRRAWLSTVRITVPPVVLMVILAPYVLELFGGQNNYRQAATPVLRLLTLSALPNVATAIAVSVARARQQMLRVFSIVAGISLLVVGMTAALVRPYGIVGVGWAWLVSQTVVAVIVYWLQLRPLWYGTSTSRLATTFAHTVALAASVPVMMRRGRISQSRISNDFASITNTVLVDHGLRSCDVRSIPTVSDLSISEVDDGGAVHVFVKVARSEAAGTSLARQTANLVALRHEANIPESWRRLLPTVAVTGERSRRVFTIEHGLPGVPASRLSYGQTAEQVTTIAISAIGTLHRATGWRSNIDNTMVFDLVEDRIARLEQLVGTLTRGRSIRALSSMRESCVAGLTDRVGWRSWTHGDYWAGNVLINADGTEVTGILDWDGANRAGLASVDVMHYLLAARVSATGKAIGHCVRQLLGGAPLTEFEADMLAPTRALDGQSGPDLATLVRLAWLGHVVNNVEKSSRYRHHRLWVHSNIESVLQWHVDER